MNAPSGSSGFRDALVLGIAGALGVGLPVAIALVAWRQAGNVGQVWLWLATALAVMAAGLLLWLWLRSDRQRRLDAGRARLETERMFREVVDGMTVGVFVLNSIDGGGDFTCAVANEAASVLSGLARQRLEGCRLGDVFVGRQGGAAIDAVHRCWRSGAPEQLAAGQYCADRAPSWFDGAVFRLTDGKVVLVAHDLCAQREIEGELRGARGELELALDALRVGFWTWFPGQAHASIDSRCAQMLGLAGAGALDLAPAMRRVHAEDLPALRRELERVVSDRCESEGEFRIAPGDGTWRRLCTRVKPIIGADGAISRVVGCAWDVTERREMETNLRRMQRLESIGTLANGVAHNLNNALAPIAMGLDLLRRRLADDIVARDSIETMTTSIRRAASVVRQLAVSTRGAVGRHLLVAPRRLLEDLEGTLRPALSPGITLQVQSGPAEIPLLWVDAAKVRDALLQLCHNACDSMAGNGRLDLECAVVDLPAQPNAQFPDLKPGRYVAFRVTDTGPGIPDSIRDRIFDPFFSTKEVGRGVGLGLSAVLGVVRGHGGGIAFETLDGTGTRFIILLPAARETAESVLSSVASTTDNGQPKPSRGESPGLVLVADDEAPVRNLTRRALELEGFRVLTAADGKEALNLFAREPAAVDVVILDLAMPVMDGATAAAAMVKLRPDVRIIAATGFTAEDILDEARRAGVTSFLAKPFSVDALVEAVRTAGGRRA